MAPKQPENKQPENVVPENKRRPFFRRPFGVKRTIGLVLAAVFIVSLFIPTPYYLYQPGDAEVLAPMVTVTGGHKTEKGSLMLTTVLSIKANNIWYLLYGKFAPHTQIMSEQDVQSGMSDAEYEKLLTHMMISSQQDAIISGLEAAGEPVKQNFNGVFVSLILPQSKANGKLEVGDVIKAVDGHQLLKAEDLTNYLQTQKRAGDTVSITFLRDKKLQTTNIQLISLGASNQTTPGVPQKPGLGIQPDSDITIDTPRNVKINAGDIGGPSAGLMFSLEIYSQIMPGDLTKGYKIAGTGTIDSQGNVGQIGGIEHKIVAAHNNGAEIFFCPADIQSYDSNYKDVVAAAKADGYNIKIVPVKTMQDAIKYLESLPPKK